MPVVIARRLPPGYDLARTAGALATGAHDPTTRVRPGEVWRSTRTPDGPAALHLRTVAGELVAEAWGPGAGWMLDGACALAGLHRSLPAVGDHHPLVTEAARRHPGLAIGATRRVFHALVPAVLGQRVTTAQALRSWAALCRAGAERAPGPAPLLLPPAAERLATTPSWWFHRVGVERRRAEVIVRAARLAARLDETADLPIDAAYGRLLAVPGIGPWTAAEIAGPAFGDPDAVPVGDFHLPHVVSYALAGEPRGTDERMLDLLAPWAGARAVVLRLIGLVAPAPPAYGPKRRVLDVARL